jgi:aspartyl-tRNA(Asn)/glutamyl-tRNA(Gln) amidotransferase subunit B
MEVNTVYEIVVGLEVHAQLSTASKLFCGDDASFGAAPNTHISPVTLAHPGTLPVINVKAVEYAVSMGLACNCNITAKNYFARKHYFYPDLPKGYQISQHTTPVCTEGYITIHMEEGPKKIRLNRIHLEEDAGKSLHDIDESYTCIDLNRAGVPLIEIVTEPDLRSGAEAYAFLSEIRKLVRYLSVCDGNMEEGSMRCDANISIRKKGDTRLGTKVEVKNLNSIRNVRKAIEYEAERLIALHEEGKPIVQQTRSYDAGKNSTFALRTKEEANDYRYFTDPDIAPFTVTPKMMDILRDRLPELPNEKTERYQQGYSLSSYDARFLTEERSLSTYFESILQSLESLLPEEGVKNAKLAANWLTGPVKSYLNENNLDWENVPLPPSSIAQLICHTQKQLINFSVAAGKVMQEMIRSGNHDALQVIRELNLEQESDADALEKFVDEVLETLSEKVTEYKKGKKGLLGLFMGEVKKRSGGKADPRIVNELLIKKLGT